jgi:hypothetical protein
MTPGPGEKRTELPPADRAAAVASDDLDIPF